MDGPLADQVWLAARRRAAMRLPSPTPLRGLLRCLDAAFFIPSFEEEGYVTVGDLRSDDAGVVGAFVASLSMPTAATERLLAWAFDEEVRGDDGATDAGSVEGAPPEAVLARCGKAFDAAWLEAVAPLYSLHMGCENMGPLLYGLLRFLKPARCLEIGAGYTTAFILQALEDNAGEAEVWRELDRRCGSVGADFAAGAESAGGAQSSWLAPGDGLERTAGGVLHCVDNLAHAGTTAHRLFEVARRLGLERRLKMELDDARAFLAESASTLPEFDFIWLDGLLDFAPPRGGDVGRGIDEFLSIVWPRLAPGGYVLLHSTLTNRAVRTWLEGVDAAPWGPPGQVLSLLEPHKRFQNSVSLLQRRPPGYAEPLYSTLP